MEKEKITIHDVDTGKTIVREMTDEEWSQFLKDVDEDKIQKSVIEKRKKSRESALSKLIDLGLTEEEIAALQANGRLRK